MSIDNYFTGIISGLTVHYVGLHRTTSDIDILTELKLDRTASRLGLGLGLGLWLGLVLGLGFQCSC